MAHSGRRLLSLDAFRGLTIAAMLLVNNPGRWGDAFIYPPLRHAAWNGCTPTDFIFPFFLFIVGVAMVFSFTHRVDEGQSRRLLFGHVWRRSLVLVLLGLFQSRFPCFPPYPGGIGEAITAAGPGGLLLRFGGLLVYVVVLAFLLGIRRTWPWSVALAVGLATTLLGQWLAPALDSSWFWHHLVEARVPGVLFRIGICYFLAAGLYLGRGSPRVLLTVTTGILVATAVWMLYVPIPGFGRPDLGIGLWRPDGEYVGVMSNWCAYVDTRLFGVRCLHTLRETGTGALVWAFDPEGLASSVAALATVLLGILCGKWMQRPLPLLPGVKLLGLILAGFSLVSGGIVLNTWIPLNKRLWTSSYVLLTAGAACSFLAVCFYAMDMRGWRRWATPFVWYGRNAITAFFLSSLVARLIVVIKVPTAGSTGSEGTTTLAATTLTLKSWLYENLFRTWACPRNSSLFYALTVVIVWALVCGFLYRRRIFIKI